MTTENTITVERLIAIGGNEWQRNGEHRIYFNDLGRWYGVETVRYGTGNINGAWLNGVELSNNKARQLLVHLNSAQLWFDVAEGKFMSRGLVDTRDFTDIRATVIANIRQAAGEVQ